MSAGHDVDDLGLTAVTQVGDRASAEEIRPGQLQMIVISNGTFEAHPLPDGSMLTIGRSNRCDIAINDKSISRQHAILNVGKTVTIEDLGSANGTRVRGQSAKLGQPVAIAVGEIVGLGHANVILQHRAWPLGHRRLWPHQDFQARLAEECARQDRSGIGFAVLYIQPERSPTDGLEEMLCELVRESDIVGKHGTGGFEVLLTDTPPEKASEALRRIERKLVEGGFKCRFTIACCPRDGVDPVQLVQKLTAPAVDKPKHRGQGIVVLDAQMQSLHQMVEKIAGSQIGVVLLGETGAGKEVFARAGHDASPRASGPFVEVNCAALTETLLESELFGHEKGAFTNATSSKPGLIEAAQAGTLLLDEIGDMPLSTQVKLLRVIEDSQLRRVGALKSRRIDVRFIAATNGDLEAQIVAGTFRRDLFFRLNGVTIVIPPLRERLAELEPLATAFITRATQPSQQPPALAPDALALMKAYDWPGNVRELKHMMERAVLLSGDGPIRPEHLSIDPQRVRTAAARGSVRGTQSPDAQPPIALPMPGAPPRRGSEEEKQAILQALERSGGNQTLAARLLGMSRRTLVNRLNACDEIYRPRKGKKSQHDA